MATPNTEAAWPFPRRTCDRCRFWSELIAGNLHNEGGAIEALCLAPKPAPLHGQYTGARKTCTAWASNHLGAVDDPHEDPARYGRLSK